MPEHPRASRRYVREHILVAETALGHSLPESAKVHHANEQRADNRNDNLVICEDQAYHMLLHARVRVRRAGGDPNRDKLCGACRQVKPRDQFPPAPSQPDGVHARCRECHAAAAREYRLAKKRRAA